jgi:hypothetical protein
VKKESLGTKKTDEVDEEEECGKQWKEFDWVLKRKMGCWKRKLLEGSMEILMRCLKEFNWFSNIWNFLL